MRVSAHVSRIGKPAISIARFLPILAEIGTETDRLYGLF
jgi:hypothetical protein